MVGPLTMDIRLIRKAFILLSPILLLSWMNAQTSSEPSGPIVQALRNQEFDKALGLLKPALQQFPGNSQLWTMQGVAYSGKGQKKEALSSFKNALRISPDAIPALQGAAQIEFDAGDAAAIPILQHLVRLRPHDATSHGMLAVLEYRLGRCEAAAPHFEKVGTLFDNEVSALHAYATCLVRLKQLDKATGVFQRALALEPNDPQERKLLASLHVLTHHPQDAIGTQSGRLYPGTGIICLRRCRRYGSSRGRVEASDSDRSHECASLPGFCSDLGRAPIVPGRNQHRE